MRNKIIKGLLITAGLLLCIYLAVIGIVDRTPLVETEHYARMMKRIDSLPAGIEGGDTIKVGWAKINLGPSWPVPIAIAEDRDGKPFEKIADSIWVRAFVFDNGIQKAAYVTADLLIIPPTVTELLNKAFEGSGFNLNNVYLSATHCHSSIGGWGPGYVGKRFAGEYDQKVVDHLTKSIVEAVKLADADKQKAQIGYARIDANELVLNRLVGDKGTEDPWLHMLKVMKDDSTTAVLTIFAAHATCLHGGYMNVHRDYPGPLIDKLESINGIDMAAFSAGAVGSMGPEFADAGQMAQIDSLSQNIYRKVSNGFETIPMQYETRLNVVRLPLELGKQQFRVSNNLRLRPWITKRLVGDYPQTVSMLRIGNVVFAGMPCDFSGELTAGFDRTASIRSIHPVTTSFNGGYMGYITADQWYDMNAYETRTMNWYGPHNGAYLTEVVRRLMEKI